MTHPTPADHDNTSARTNAPQRGHSGTTAIPRGQPVPPCPYPCATCRAKGRQ
ncbi:hypothetical protein SNOUR_33775 [Streptomyces noursei ATCC 11455]|nr:hypothetical protein SNOUR_33775 [Streptomyces noursei ATCC 11455]